MIHRVDRGVVGLRRGKFSESALAVAGSERKPRQATQTRRPRGPDWDGERPQRPMILFGFEVNVIH